MLSTDLDQTARGAILIFLLIQITSGSEDVHIKIGTSNSWTEYVKFLPSEFPLPTFWNDAERKLLDGTSLKAALQAKLKSLDREFAHLRESTEGLECCKYWWDAEVGRLSINDWKTVDAMFRSRALDLPGTGHAMVPYIDMANHASGDETVALYDTDMNGNGILVLRDGKRLKAGEEVTITYGDEKGACEMLFSYGFIEGNMHGEDVEDDILSTREIFLDDDIPDDDPLKRAKKSAFDAPPGFRIFLQDGNYEWEGPFVWLSCINEEDGLSFQVLQLNDGERELTATWNSVEIRGIQMLEKRLQTDPLWDVFQLRATTLIQNRIKRQIQDQEDNVDYFEEARNEKLPVSSQRFKTAGELLNRELFFLSMAWDKFEGQVLLVPCISDITVLLINFHRERNF